MTPAERKQMGERFRLAREALPSYFTLKSLCRDFHLTPAMLQAIEAGQIEPTAMQAFNIASVYCIQLPWFLNRKSDVPDESRDFHDDTAEQIRLAREKSGLDVYQTALALNVPITYWEEIESAIRPLDFAIGVRACILFRANVEEMVRPMDGRRLPVVKSPA